jgi:hypothetical protein
MNDVCLRSTALGEEFDAFVHSNHYDLKVALAELARMCMKLKQQALITDMAEIMNTNGYICACIQDKTIARLDASIKPGSAFVVNAVRLPSRTSIAKLTCCQSICTSKIPQKRCTSYE